MQIRFYDTEMTSVANKVIEIIGRGTLVSIVNNMFFGAGVLRLNKLSPYTYIKQTIK